MDYDDGLHSKKGLSEKAFGVVIANEHLYPLNKQGV